MKILVSKTNPSITYNFNYYAFTGLIYCELAIGGKDGFIFHRGWWKDMCILKLPIIALRGAQPPKEYSLGFQLYRRLSCYAYHRISIQATSYLDSLPFSELTEEIQKWRQLLIKSFLLTQ